MGIYSNNGTQLNPVEVVAAEGYYGQVGNAQALVELCENDMAVFNAVIEKDFQEAYAIKGGTILESEIMSIQEGVVSGLFAKIKELFTKLLAKLKGIWAAFMRRFDSVVMKDNKAFVKKYELEVRKKDLTDMKYKWSKPTDKELTLPKDMPQTLDRVHVVIDDKITDHTKRLEAYAKWREDNLDDQKYANELFAKAVGQTGELTKAEFIKEADELLFEAEEESDTGAREIVNTAMNVLTDSKVAIKAAENSNKELERIMTALIKAAETNQKNKDNVLKNDKAEAENVRNSNDRASKVASLQYDMAIQIQTFVLAFNQENLKAVQKEIREYRKVFAKAVVYNKSVKEDADLSAVIEEAASYDVDSLFEAY